MAWGGVRGTVSGGATSIPVGGAMAGSTVGGVPTAVIGDLIYVAVTERGAVHVTAVTDNLGGAAYTAKSAGTASGNVSTRIFRKVADVAGAITTITGSGTASSDDYAIALALFEGPFNSSPVDKSVADATDTASPFTCTATGTLTEARELVVVTCAMTVNRTLAATSPNLLAIQGNSAAAGTSQSCGVAIGSQVVAATTSIAPAFTGTNPTTAVETTESFFSRQPLTQTALYTDTDAISAPTVTPGAVNLAPTLFTDTDALYAPTVALPAQELTQSAIYTDTDTLSAPIVSATYALTPTLYTDTDALYAPTVAFPAQALTQDAVFADTDTLSAPVVTSTYGLTGTLYTDAETVFAPTVTPGAVSLIETALYTDDDTISLPTVSATYSLSQAALYTDADTFSAATISTTVGLTATLYADTDTLSAPTVATTYAIVQPTTFADVDAFYVASVSTTTIGGGEQSPFIANMARLMNR